MRFIHFISCISIGVLGLSCRNENAGKPTVPLPNNPEGVVRLYQKYLDENSFKSAEALCTEAERVRLIEIAEIIGEEPVDSTVFSTIFLELNCTTQSDSAICACLIKDFEETYQDTFRLVKLDGQWLVDVREEPFSIENDKLFEDFELDIEHENE